jgi:ferredoxin
MSNVRSEETDNSLHVEADPTICAASGQCVLAAPMVFAQNEQDGTVVVIDAHPPLEELAAVMMAVDGCPTQALRLVE